MIIQVSVFNCFFLFVKRKFVSLPSISIIVSNWKVYHPSETSQ